MPSSNKLSKISEFNEKLYLRKYPDVAGVVAAGIIPSGEWHYNKYGKNEGRTAAINPITDQSEAWKAYIRCAAHHTEIKDFTLFDEMMQKIRDGDNFHVARYNDGEWVFMLRIEPFFSRFIKDHGHDKQEVIEISEKLLSIIDSSPDYYIGVDSTTRAHQNLINSQAPIFEKKIKNLKKLIYGDIFNAATVRFGIDALIVPLKTRFVILVGPEYMSKLQIPSIHVQVPLTNCWNQSARIQEQLDTIIKNNLDQNPVIIYSCSLLAKFLVDAFYHKYQDQISQLDVGSCIDPWCGFISRPWHFELVKHFLLTATIDPAFLKLA